MMLHGCEFFSKTLVLESLTTVNPMINFCNPTDPLLKGRRSVRPLCPKTCGCLSTVKEYYIRLGVNWSTDIGKDTQCAQACFASSPQLAPARNPINEESCTS